MAAKTSRSASSVWGTDQQSAVQSRGTCVRAGGAALRFRHALGTETECAAGLDFGVGLGVLRGVGVVGGVVQCPVRPRGRSGTGWRLPMGYT